MGRESLGSIPESPSQPEPEADQYPPEPQPSVGGGVPPILGSDCSVKGNVSSSGELIYHVPGGFYYDATDPEECFATETDAVAEVYRASKQ